MASDALDKIDDFLEVVYKYALARAHVTRVAVIVRQLMLVLTMRSTMLACLVVLGVGGSSRRRKCVGELPLEPTGA